MGNGLVCAGDGHGMRMQSPVIRHGACWPTHGALGQHLFYWLQIASSLTAVVVVCQSTTGELSMPTHKADGACNWP